MLPMHGSLTNEEQLRVFQRPLNGHRKVIVATNVAEASITIPGIVYGMLDSHTLMSVNNAKLKILNFSSR